LIVLHILTPPFEWRRGCGRAPGIFAFAPNTAPNEILPNPHLPHSCCLTCDSPKLSGVLPYQ
jgi:hypothetical protein